MDKLEQMLAAQAELQRRLGTNFSELTLKERAEFMRNHRGYLEDELAEALYEMPFYKLWKNYDEMSEEATSIAWQKVRMELVDCLHFFMNLMLCAGMTADEIYEMYMAKNKENNRRQDEGYTADKSYRSQSVEEVMGAVPTCTVSMDGETAGSNDFITILNTPNNETMLYYSTDVITLGKAIQMLSKQYTAQLAKLPQETADEIREVLAHG